MTWPEEAVAGGASEASGVHPIEAETYGRLRSRNDRDRLPRFSRDVTERVIHASADFDYATDLVCDEEALAAGVQALAGGAAVVADTEMVAAGITGRDVVCKIREPLSARLARTLLTRLTELKQANPDAAVVIRPDRELPVQKLIALMDALQRAQITKVGIATKAEAK